MKLLTLADGFGDSKISTSWYPDFFKWPEIIHLMTRGVDLVNLSRYGAGNEYISQCLRSNITKKDAVIVQWAVPNRLDLVLSHPTDFWNKEIAEDPVYHNNVVSITNDRYWISSSSKNPHVIDYHQKYISVKQHQLRSQLFVDYAKLLLESHDIKHGFLLTWDSEYLQESVTDTTNWFWHQPFKGMDSFRKISQYAELDQNLNLVQPMSLVQFDFIKRFIMPCIDLNWRSDRDISAVENMLYRKYKEAVVKRDDSL